MIEASKIKKTRRGRRKVRSARPAQPSKLRRTFFFPSTGKNIEARHMGEAIINHDKITL